MFEPRVIPVLEPIVNFLLEPAINPMLEPVVNLLLEPAVNSVLEPDDCTMILAIRTRIVILRKTM